MLATPVVPSDPARGTRPVFEGDTKIQTISTLNAIQKALKAQGLGMGDVIQMRIYLVGDPALDNKMDFAGLNAAYDQFFGTPEQANKPVRAALQVTALAFPAALVEIEVVAARSAQSK
jgi:enamine deaminase RidA (YjgF/YER057c/UK114 family)